MAVNNIIKAKTNIFEGFNKLNHALTRQSLDLEIIEGILDKYKFPPSTLIRKLYTQIYNYPWIITYFNKYMNYLGITSCSLIDFIKAFRYVLLCNGVLDSRRFYFMKMTAERDDMQMKIIDLLDRYFTEQFDVRFNYRELLFFYNLYLNGIISSQDLHEIDLMMNNNSKTISFQNLPSEKPKEKSISVDKLIKRYSESSRGIDFINNKIYQNRLEKCSECPYKGREIVPFDGNVKDINDVDVIIVNLNPDLNDLKEKRIFREKSIVRQNISLFPKNIKWILVNLIPCAFKGKSELGKDFDEIKNQLKMCNKVSLDVIKENIKPKITVFIGQETTSTFLPAANFEETLGILTDGQYVSVLHPNSMKNAKAQIRGKKCWESVQNLIRNIASPCQEEKEDVQEPVKTAAVEENREVQTEKCTKNKKYLLLDVKEIENGNYVLMIFTDEDGNKHYEKKRNTTSGYIKESGFKNCSILTDSVDYEFTMTKADKFKLTKLLREKMAKLKGS